jgi:hypothetical protein
MKPKGEKYLPLDVYAAFKWFGLIPYGIEKDPKRLKRYWRQYRDQILARYCEQYGEKKTARMEKTFDKMFSKK